MVYYNVMSYTCTIGFHSLDLPLNLKNLCMHISIKIRNFDINSSTIQTQCMNQLLFQSTSITITSIPESPYRHLWISIFGGLAPLSTYLPLYVASQSSICVGLSSFVHNLYHDQSWCGGRIFLASGTSLMRRRVYKLLSSEPTCPKIDIIKW